MIECEHLRSEWIREQHQDPAPAHGRAEVKQKTKNTKKVDNSRNTELCGEDDKGRWTTTTAHRKSSCLGGKSSLTEREARGQSIVIKYVIEDLNCFFNVFSFQSTIVIIMRSTPPPTWVGPLKAIDKVQYHMKMYGPQDLWPNSIKDQSHLQKKTSQQKGISELTLVCLPETTDHLFSLPTIYASRKILTADRLW